MANLEFPNETFTLHLAPAKAVGGIGGTIRLATVQDVDYVQVTLDSAGSGESPVVYTPMSQNCGLIDAFDLTITYSDSTIAVWRFAGLVVSKSEEGHIYVVTDSVDLGDGARKLAGIPGAGRRPPVVRMGVSQNGVPIGDLMVVDHVGIRFVTFHPLHGRPVPAVWIGDQINWIYDGTTFSGSRFAFLLDSGGNCPSVSHGYVGVATSKDRSVDDWEATAAIPPGPLDDDDRQILPRLPKQFPDGEYRMSIAASTNDGVDVEAGRARNGNCQVLLASSQLEFTLVVGSEISGAIPASYTVNSVDDWSIRLNNGDPFQFGGETWCFKRDIRAVKRGRFVYLFSPEVEINGTSFRFSAFPAGSYPFSVKTGLPVWKRGGTSQGTLTINDHKSGEFLDNGSGKHTATIYDSATVVWTQAGKLYSGFPAILRLVDKNHITFGYVGTATLVTALGTKSVEDWEATPTYPIE